MIINNKINNIYYTYNPESYYDLSKLDYNYGIYIDNIHNIHNDLPFLQNKEYKNVIINNISLKQINSFNNENIHYITNEIVKEPNDSKIIINKGDIVGLKITDFNNNIKNINNYQHIYVEPPKNMFDNFTYFNELLINSNKLQNIKFNIILNDNFFEQRLGSHLLTKIKYINTTNNIIVIYNDIHKNFINTSNQIPIIYNNSNNNSHNNSPLINYYIYNEKGENINYNIKLNKISESDILIYNCPEF
jgi:hypothetical protein